MKTLKLRYRLEIARAILAGIRSGRFGPPDGHSQPKWYLEIRPLEDTLFRQGQSAMMVDQSSKTRSNSFPSVTEDLNEVQIAEISKSLRNRRQHCPGCEFCRKGIKGNGQNAPETS